jgi:hypothetical protein
MTDPKRTGISAITGKLVVIRHATETDLVRINERYNENNALSDLGSAEVVVALESDRIIGFGVLRREEDSGCMSIYEDSRRKGIGESIKSHFMAIDPPARVYATRNITYFTVSGLKQRKRATPAITKTTAAGRCSMPLMERVAV